MQAHQVAGVGSDGTAGMGDLTFGDMELPTGDDDELQQLVSTATALQQEPAPQLAAADGSNGGGGDREEDEEEEDDDAASVTSEPLPPSPHQLQLGADTGQPQVYTDEFRPEQQEQQGSITELDAQSNGAAQEEQGDAENRHGGLGSSNSSDEEAVSQLATVASLALENLSMLSTSTSLQPPEAADAGPTSTASTSPQQQQQQQAQAGRGGEASSGEDARWRSHPKHLLMLTSSGKPVYTYHGDADSLAGLMALITALVSVVQDQGDKLHHLIAGGTLVVLVMRGPLILVAATRCGEAVEVLQRQLELMYRQILLIVTTGVERILLRNPAYDVRTLLEGVGAVLTRLVCRMHHDASYLLHGLQPVALPSADHAAVQAALADAVKSSGAYYGMLLVSSGGYVVAEQRGIAANGKPVPPLDASDVMLLDNFVACNASIRLQHGEAFCPLCLPAYNPAAFLHAYIHFLTPPTTSSAPTELADSHAASRSDGMPVESDSSSQLHQQHPGSTQGVYLVLLAPTSDGFHALSQARQTLEAQLVTGGQLLRLQQALTPHQGSAWTSVEQLPPSAGGGQLGCTPLWHFMARLVPRRQVVCAQYTAPFATPAAQQRLAASYGRLHSLVMDYPAGGRPNRMVWLSTEQHILLAMMDAEVELFMVLDPLCDKATAQRCAEQLRKHVASPAFLRTG